MTVTLIAAADRNWGIGLGGALPWNVAEDLMRFRRRTRGRVVIMGRRTVEGLPRTLDDRRVVTISRSGHGDYTSVEEALRAYREEEEVFVAGGEGVFAEAATLADRAEITRIQGNWNCDTHMPHLGAAGWCFEYTEIAHGLNIEHWSRK